MAFKSSELQSLVDEVDTEGQVSALDTAMDPHRFQRQILWLSFIGTSMLLVSVAAARVAVSRTGSSPNAIYFIEDKENSVNGDGNRNLELATVNQSATISHDLGSTSVIIAWQANPTKCWSVLDTPSHNAKKIVSSDCSAAERWIIPSHPNGVPIGPSQVKWERHPSYCLDHPGSATDVIQLWNCSDAPTHNTRFVFPYSGTGVIKTAGGNPSKCLNIPHDEERDKKYLQAWACSKDASDDEHFSIRHPADCKWGQWNEWSTCKSGEHKRSRSRTKALRETLGGRSCSGSAEQAVLCNSTTKLRFLFENVSRLVAGA